MTSLINFWRNYFNFSGKASRGEFWVSAFMIAVVNVVLTSWMNRAGSMSYITQDSELIGVSEPSTGLAGNLYKAIIIFNIVIIIPTLSLIFRRMHDAGFKNLWTIVLLFPPAWPILFAILTFAPTHIKCTRSIGPLLQVSRTKLEMINN